MEPTTLQAYKETLNSVKPPVTPHIKQIMSESKVRRKSLIKKVKAYMTKSLTGKASVDCNNLQEKENGYSQHESSTLTERHKADEKEEVLLNETVSSSIEPHEYLEIDENDPSDLSFLTDNSWSTKKRMLSKNSDTSQVSIKTWKTKASLSIESKYSWNKKADLKEPGSIEPDTPVIIEENVKKKLKEDVFSSDESLRNIKGTTSKEQILMNRCQLARDTIALLTRMNGNTLSNQLREARAALDGTLLDVTPDEHTTIKKSSKKTVPSEKSLINRIMTKIGIPSRAKLRSKKQVVKKIDPILVNFVVSTCFIKDNGEDIKNESQITLTANTAKTEQMTISSKTIFPDSSTTFSGRISTDHSYSLLSSQNYTRGSNTNINSSTEACVIKSQSHTTNYTDRNFRNFLSYDNQQSNKSSYQHPAKKPEAYNEDYLIYHVDSLPNNSSIKKNSYNGLDKKSVLVISHLNDKHNLDTIVNDLLLNVDISQVSSIFVVVPSSNDTETELSASEFSIANEEHQPNISTPKSQLETFIGRQSGIKEKFKPFTVFNQNKANFNTEYDDNTNIGLDRGAIDAKEQNLIHNLRILVQKSLVDLDTPFAEDTQDFVSDVNVLHTSISPMTKPFTNKVPKLTIIDTPPRDESSVQRLDTKGKESKVIKPIWKGIKWQQFNKQQIKDKIEVQQKSPNAIKRNMPDINNSPMLAEISDFMNEHHRNTLNSSQSETLLPIRNVGIQNSVIQPLTAFNQRPRREIEREMNKHLENKQISTEPQVLREISQENPSNGHGKMVYRKKTSNMRSIGCGGKVSHTKDASEGVKVLISTLSKYTGSCKDNIQGAIQKIPLAKPKLIIIDSYTSSLMNDINQKPQHKSTEKYNPQKEILQEDFSVENYPEGVPQHYSYVINNEPSLFSCVEKSHQRKSFPDLQFPFYYFPDLEASKRESLSPRMNGSRELDLSPERDSALMRYPRIDPILPNPVKGSLSRIMSPLPNYSLPMTANDSRPCTPKNSSHNFFRKIIHKSSKSGSKHSLPKCSSSRPKHSPRSSKKSSRHIISNLSVEKISSKASRQQTSQPPSPKTNSPKQISSKQSLPKVKKSRSKISHKSTKMLEANTSLGRSCHCNPEVLQNQILEALKIEMIHCITATGVGDHHNALDKHLVPLIETAKFIVLQELSKTMPQKKPERSSTLKGAFVEKIRETKNKLIQRTSKKPNPKVLANTVTCDRPCMCIAIKQNEEDFVVVAAVSKVLPRKNSKGNSQRAESPTALSDKNGNEHTVSCCRDRECKEKSLNSKLNNNIIVKGISEEVIYNYLQKCDDEQIRSRLYREVEAENSKFNNPTDLISEHRRNPRYTSLSDTYLPIWKQYTDNQNSDIKPTIAITCIPKKEIKKQIEHKRKSTEPQHFTTITPENPSNGPGKMVYRKRTFNTRSIGCGGNVRRTKYSTEDVKVLISTLTKYTGPCKDIQGAIVNPVLNIPSPKMPLAKPKLIIIDSCTSSHLKEINQNLPQKSTKKYYPQKQILHEDFLVENLRDDIPKDYSHILNNKPSLFGCSEKSHRQKSFPELQLPQNCSPNREDFKSDLQSSRELDVSPERDSALMHYPQFDHVLTNPLKGSLSKVNSTLPKLSLSATKRSPTYSRDNSSPCLPKNHRKSLKCDSEHSLTRRLLSAPKASPHSSKKPSWHCTPNLSVQKISSIASRQLISQPVSPKLDSLMPVTSIQSLLKVKKSYKTSEKSTKMCETNISSERPCHCNTEDLQKLILEAIRREKMRFVTTTGVEDHPDASEKHLVSLIDTQKHKDYQEFSNIMQQKKRDLKASGYNSSGPTNGQSKLKDSTVLPDKKTSEDVTDCNSSTNGQSTMKKSTVLPEKKTGATYILKKIRATKNKLVQKTSANEWRRKKLKLKLDTTDTCDKPCMCFVLKKKKQDDFLVVAVSEVLTVVPRKYSNGNSLRTESRMVFEYLRDKKKRTASCYHRECKISKEKDKKSRRNHKDEVKEISEEVIYNYLQKCEERQIRSKLYAEVMADNTDRYFSEKAKTGRDYPTGFHSPTDGRSKVINHKTSNLKIFVSSCYLPDHDSLEANHTYDIEPTRDVMQSNRNNLASKSTNGKTEQISDLKDGEMFGETIANSDHSRFSEPFRSSAEIYKICSSGILKLKLFPKCERCILKPSPKKQGNEATSKKKSKKKKMRTKACQKSVTKIEKSTSIMKTAGRKPRTNATTQAATDVEGCECQICSCVNCHGEGCRETQKIEKSSIHSSIMKFFRRLSSSEVSSQSTDRLDFERIDYKCDDDGQYYEQHYTDFPANSSNEVDQQPRRHRRRRYRPCWCPHNPRFSSHSIPSTASESSCSGCSQPSVCSFRVKQLSRGLKFHVKPRPSSNQSSRSCFFDVYRDSSAVLPSWMNVSGKCVSLSNIIQLVSYT